MEVVSGFVGFPSLIAKLPTVTAMQLVKMFTNHCFGALQTGARFSLQNKVGIPPVVYVAKVSKCCCTFKCLEVHSLSEDKKKKSFVVVT